MIALAHYGLKPADVIAELERREGTSGIEEKALRKAQASARQGRPDGTRPISPSSMPRHPTTAR